LRLGDALSAIGYWPTRIQPQPNRNSISTSVLTSHEEPVNGKRPAKTQRHDDGSQIGQFYNERYCLSVSYTEKPHEAAALG
jgi:hypothetical protein